MSRQRVMHAWLRRTAVSNLMLLTRQGALRQAVFEGPRFFRQHTDLLKGGAVRCDKSAQGTMSLVTITLRYWRSQVPGAGRVDQEGGVLCSDVAI